MAPPTTFVALLVVLALAPGWLFLRLTERLEPPRTSSGLHQLLEVLAVGAATTGVSVLLLVLTPHWLLPFTLDVEAWAKNGSKALRADLRGAAWSSAVLLLFSFLAAFLLAKARKGRRPGSFAPNGTVWSSSMGAVPANKAPYVGLHLEDGRLVEGLLHSYSLDVQDENRDIGLARPIRITEAGGRQPADLPNLDRLIVGADKIAFISVHHAPRVAPLAPTRRLRWRSPLPLSRSSGLGPRSSSSLSRHQSR